jgi:trehalose 6-phosphate synthase
MGQPPRKRGTRSPRSEAEPTRRASDDSRAIGPRSALLRDLLGRDGRIVVVSNRGPITFEHDPDAPGGLTAARGPGGLVTALAELGRHAPLTWVSAALTDADRLAGPHLDPASTTRAGRRVRELLAGLLPGQDVRLVYAPIPGEVYERHYGVLSNPFLWFLQHEMYATAYAPNVDETLLDAWRAGYRPVNAQLADAAVEAAGGHKRPVILVQDYHLYLAPERIRERLPGATILHFTHIPWPADSQWQLIPQAMRRAICEGLLASDIVGFQTDRYASHFLDSVASFVRDAKVDRDSRNVAWRGRRIRVRTYPISVDPEGLRAFSHSGAVEGPLARLVERLERAGNPRLIVRADRIEPSKNALRGFLAFEAMLERRPELRRTVRFVAVQAPTRTEIAEYADYAAAVREVVARINRIDEPEDQPIWVYDGSDYGMAIAALRLADVVVVNPIVDGMNLVAKEAVLVGERNPVLVLSETAGAAEQLAADSISVAPADVAGTTAALERALAMGADERRARLRRMRASVRQEDLDWWLGRQLRDLAAIRHGQLPPSRRLRDTVRRVEEVAV